MLKGNLLYLLYAVAVGAVGVAGFYVVPKIVNATGPDKPAIAKSQSADSGKSSRPLSEKPEVVTGSGTEPATKSGTDTEPEPEPATGIGTDTGAATATEMAKVDSEASAPDLAAKPIVPGFDILRVEPDGSMVIAGSGAPNSVLEIIQGETVIATTKIGPTGDFVAVLDEPLPPGDYQLRLRNTLPDGGKVISEDVATVSVPDVPSGQLLAMVGKPGEASRILTQPETKEPVEKPAEVASVENEANANSQTDASTSQMDATSRSVVLPALPDAAAKITGEAPTIGSEGEPVAEETAPNSDAVEPTSEVAAIDPTAVAPAVEPVKPAEPVASAESAEDGTIRVDAVEIEGGKIYIAGGASAGFKVRVLADGVEIGTETVDENGRFIIESTHELSVGNHEITAELIAPNSGEVVLRAVVPFARPEGDKVAAVARSNASPQAALQTDPQTEDTASTASSASPGSLSLPELANLNGLRDDVLTEMSKVETMMTPGANVSTQDLNRSSGDLAKRLEKMTDTPLPENATDEAMKSAGAMKETAQNLLKSLKENSGLSGDALPDVEQMAKMRATIGEALAVLSGPDAATDPKTNMPSTEKMPSTDMAAVGDSAEPAAAGTSSGNDARTVEQAPLEPAAGSVIIRRGDTLWQISRRTYGQGVRYTTIYLANQQQIKNPDRISPGQVFQVPETPETMDDAERVHHQLLGGEKPGAN